MTRLHVAWLAVALVTTACGSDAPVTPAGDAGEDALAAEGGAPFDAAVDAPAPPADAGDAAADAGALGTLFGAAFSPHDAAHYDALVTAWGGVQVSRSYDGGSGAKPFLNTYQAQDIARGAASAYSFKYAPSEVIAGTHDADIQSFFDGIKDGHPVFWTYWHEPDDEIFKSKTFTATDYRDAWAHIRKIADAAKAKRPKMIAYATLIIMQYSMTPAVAPSRPLTGPNGMYPGDAVIDVFGVDAYNSAADKGGVVDAATQFGKVIDFAEAHGKRWAIGELGSCPVKGDANGRATYLQNAVHYWVTRNDPPVFAAYFDLDWPTCDYRLDADAPATAVWKKAVTQGVAAF